MDYSKKAQMLSMLIKQHTVWRGKNLRIPDQNRKLVNILECRMDTYRETKRDCQDGCDQKKNFHLMQKQPKSQQKDQMFA